MNDQSNDNSTRELSDTDRGSHANEVPMPEQQTGDAPDQLPHMSDGMSSDEKTPDHPESDRS